MSVLNLNGLDDFCDAYCWPYHEEDGSFSHPMERIWVCYETNLGMLILNSKFQVRCPHTNLVTYVYGLMWIGDDGFDLFDHQLAICVDL